MLRRNVFVAKLFRALRCLLQDGCELRGENNLPDAAAINAGLTGKRVENTINVATQGRHAHLELFHDGGHEAVFLRNKCRKEMDGLNTLLAVFRRHELRALNSFLRFAGEVVRNHSHAISSRNYRVLNCHVNGWAFQLVGKLHIPYHFITMKLLRDTCLLIAAILAVHGFASVIGWYSDIWWFDEVMHWSGGFAMGMLGSWCFLRAARSISCPLLVRFGWVIGFVALIGIGWEWFEFVCDRVLPSVIDGYQLAQPSLSDTMSDLFLDLFGGVMGYFFARRYGRS